MRVATGRKYRGVLSIRTEMMQPAHAVHRMAFTTDWIHVAARNRLRSKSPSAVTSLPRGALEMSRTTRPWSSALALTSAGLAASINRTTGSGVCLSTPRTIQLGIRLTPRIGRNDPLCPELIQERLIHRTVVRAERSLPLHDLNLASHPAFAVQHLRPFFVFIRARNPILRARLILLDLWG